MRSLEYVSYVAYIKNRRVTKICDEPCLEFTQGASFLRDTSLVVNKIEEQTCSQTFSYKLPPTLVRTAWIWSKHWKKQFLHFIIQSQIMRTACYIVKGWNNLTCLGSGSAFLFALTPSLSSWNGGITSRNQGERQFTRNTIRTSIKEILPHRAAKLSAKVNLWNPEQA